MPVVLLKRNNREDGLSYNGFTASHSHFLFYYLYLQMEVKETVFFLLC